MHAASSILPSQRQGKRRADAEDGTLHKRMRRSRRKRTSLEETDIGKPTTRLTLLDLPIELLLEIFGLSASAALPETCWSLYNAFYANPKLNSVSDGPPMWLQKKFIAGTNPTMSFAVQRCLRRRFFSAETLRMYLPALLESGSLDSLSIPMRCIARDSSHTRELLLYTELFLNGVTLSTPSTNKALVHIAAHQNHIDTSSLFWKSTKKFSFTTYHVLQAFKLAAKRKAFDPQTGTFAHLVKRFGIDDAIGHELYDMAAATHDLDLIAVLQQHDVSPDMAALQKVMNMMNS